MYRDAHELAGAVATFLGSGFDAREPAVAVVTAAHWPLMSERLRRRGCDVEALERAGMLVRADADATLAAICEDGGPGKRAFNDIVGGLIDRAAAAAPGRRVRVFGEMVDILCRRGDAAAADALETLWNRLGTRRNFTLLCGYRVDVFDREAQLTLLPQVYRAHSHVLPAVDAERMEAAVSRALADVLGDTDAQKVYARVALQSRERHVPVAQLALMWVSAHMPRTAERVLALARTHYLGTQSAPA